MSKRNLFLCVLAACRDPHPFSLPHAGEGEGEGFSRKERKACPERSRRGRQGKACDD